MLKRKMSLRSVIIITLAIVVAALLFAWGGGLFEPSATMKRALSRQEQARRDSIYRASFKVGVTPTIDCAPLFVAEAAHLFDTLGVKVNLVRLKAHMDGDTALVGGSIEGMATDLVRAERIVKGGTPLRYPIATSLSWQMVAARKARVTTTSQLSDKMIAMTRFSATDAFSTMYINKAKPKFDVYRVQINDVDLRLKMILGGQMDAAMLPEPQATAARQKGHNVLEDSQKSGHRFGVMAFRAASMNTRRTQQLSLFIRAYNMAVDSINRYGIVHYAPTLQKQLHTDLRTLKQLPRITFSHAAAPRQSDIEEARKW